MSLVRYGTNVFDLDDVYGLDLYDAGDTHNLRVVLRGGESSFKIRFDSERAARRAYETICEELEVRDITDEERDWSETEGPNETVAAE